MLDGGLATTLEDMGHDLDDDLWSARILMNDPAAIREVHEVFLRAGADCITTATYQATIAGFVKRGLSEPDARARIRAAVGLATDARDAFWAAASHQGDRVRPLVAASVGPYGAYLADGSEYVGQYGVSPKTLRDFHEPRWKVLSDAGADMLACETVPDATEAVELLGLLGETPGVWAWFSFSCRDDRHLHDGTPLREMAGLCDATPRVAAVGINCTEPSLVASLLKEAREGTGLPLIVYPNSGERYDASTRRWRAGTSFDWREGLDVWTTLGAAGVGGCCRVGPDTIAAIRAQTQQTGQ